MIAGEEELLDRTDRFRRLLQHGVVWLGIVLLFLAGAVLRKSIEGRAGRIGAIGAGLGIVVMASAVVIKVRWDVDYKGHRIHFDNDPFTGERLFIDGIQVAKGGLGRRMVLKGTIPGGAGAGDVITATAEAGLTKFRCRIVAEAAAPAARLTPAGTPIPA